MPRTTPAASSTATIGLLCILFIAFFPGLFHYLWTIPLSILFTSEPTRTPQAISTTAGSSTTMWVQRQFSLPPKSRGAYLVTDHVLKELPEIRNFKVGLLNLFIQHTSCALSMNENWDEDVRADMSDALDRIAPDSGPKGEALYRHDAEGSDDMPAHIKSSLMGVSVTVPIKDGKLATGTWQGIWYLEFRTSKHARRVMATIQGEEKTAT